MFIITINHNQKILKQLRFLSIQPTHAHTFSGTKKNQQQEMSWLANTIQITRNTSLKWNKYSLTMNNLKCLYRYVDFDD